MNDKSFNEFNLVGGTALSLQMGHRRSIDIDLFNTGDFDAKSLALYLERQYAAEDIRVLKNGIFCFIKEVKVDLISHKYPLVHPPLIVEGIRMSDPRDIGGMKLHAIVDSGKRLKDFVDMYFLLERFPLEELLSAYVGKYPDRNAFMAETGLLYHKEIRQETIKFMNRKVDLRQMSARFELAVKDPKKRFLHYSLGKNIANRQDGQNRKNRGFSK
jgi:hypothetical protein